MSVQAPPREIWSVVLPELQSYFAKIFQLRVDPGTRVTSWWRDQAVNAAVGGVPTSFHLWGLALDVVAPDPGFIIDQGRALGLDAFDAGTHVHLEPLGRPPNFQVPSSARA